MDGKKTAIVIGATGLVGKALLWQLLDDADYDKVLIFVRRSTGILHPKLEEHVIDFAKAEAWAASVQGDVLFSSLGTTRSQAGSKAAQRVVDYDYQYQFAKVARSNGVGCYVLVSSIGADAGSSAFYLKMKGELDRDVASLGFARCHILRPGPLAGPRVPSRTMERIFLGLLGFLNKLGMLRRYRPIHDVQMGRAMRVVAKMPVGAAQIHESGQLFQLLEAN